MVITKEEIERAFEQAKQHAIEVYPLYDKMLNYIILKISNDTSKEKHALAEAKYDQYLIIAYLPTIQQYEAKYNAGYDEESMYYVFLHEFAHILQDRVDRHSPSHGSIFKTIAYNLGLKNPARITPPVGHTMYILSVPTQTGSGKIVKKRFYVLQEWLDENPEYKKYEVSHYNHP